MKTYPLPMVPGPVRVPDDILAVWNTDYGAPALEDDFKRLHQKTEAALQTLLGTRNRVVMQTGEAMLVLWAALKSCLSPGDRVLSLATGVFGYGIAEMARAIGAAVKVFGLDHDRTLNDLNPVSDAVRDWRPKMITAVHCETPSGTFNPIADIGRLKYELNVPLLYVDAVSSVGGAPIETDAFHIDLALGGSQKCLSAPPCMSFLSVSERAWEIVDAVGYAGYEALSPFRHAPQRDRLPYTPYWHGMAALHRAASRVLTEGLDKSFERHDAVARYVRNRAAAMGLRLFPRPDAVPATTVTALQVPPGMTWLDLDARLREKGLVLGGSLGPLDGRVFRIGHMGSQADPGMAEAAMDILAEVVGARG